LQIAATQNSCIFRLKKKSWESNARTWLGTHPCRYCFCQANILLV
jgi:hypothetical protein